MAEKFLFKIACSCGTSFELNSERKTDHDVICPNCGKQLPDPIVAGIGNVYQSLSELDNRIFAECDGFNISVVKIA